VRFPEVVEVRRMFGRIDYIVRVGTRDLDAFETFAIDQLRAIRGESLITMKVIKRDWPA
jgi:DNA-binding Lrp family transcriptional regulator